MDGLSGNHCYLVWGNSFSVRWVPSQLLSVTSATWLERNSSGGRLAAWHCQTGVQSTEIGLTGLSHSLATRVSPTEVTVSRWGVACRQCIRWHPDKITGPNDYVAAGPFDLIPSRFLKTIARRSAVEVSPLEVMRFSLFLHFCEAFRRVFP